MGIGCWGLGVRDGVLGIGDILFEFPQIPLVMRAKAFHTGFCQVNRSKGADKTCHRSKLDFTR